MRFEILKKLSDGQFRRLTGVTPKTFATMVEIVKREEKIKKSFGGRPNKLSIRPLLKLDQPKKHWMCPCHPGQGPGIHICLISPIKITLLDTGKVCLACGQKRENGHEV